MIKMVSQIDILSATDQVVRFALLEQPSYNTGDFQVSSPNGFNKCQISINGNSFIDTVNTPVSLGNGMYELTLSYLNELNGMESGVVYLYVNDPNITIKLYIELDVVTYKIYRQNLEILKFLKNKTKLVKTGSVYFLEVYDDDGTTALVRHPVYDKSGNQLTALPDGVIAEKGSSTI